MLDIKCLRLGGWKLLRTPEFGKVINVDADEKTRNEIPDKTVASFANSLMPYKAGGTSSMDEIAKLVEKAKMAEVAKA